MLRVIRRHPVLSLGGVIAIGFSIILIATGGDLASVGFLVLGALVAAASGLISEEVRRPTQARDLAHALHIELADRVARCCFDSEWPWNKYSDEDKANIEMTPFRVRKFIPNEPIVYRASANQLGLLPKGAATAIIHFYNRLDAWGRDIENRAGENEGGRLEADEIYLLSRRIRQTLGPGLRALETLSSQVEDYEQVERAAIAGYDEFRARPPDTRSLRERVRAAMAGDVVRTEKAEKPGEPVKADP